MQLPVTRLSFLTLSLKQPLPIVQDSGLPFLGRHVTSHATQRGERRLRHNPRRRFACLFRQAAPKKWDRDVIPR